MLLEQHKDAVLQLLSDSKLLEKHVNLALKTLKESVTLHCQQDKHRFAYIVFQSSLSVSLDALC